MKPLALSLALALIVLSATAGAVDVGQHPAVFSPRSLPGIDPSTFIVGHPAGGHGKADAIAMGQPSTVVTQTHATTLVAEPESLAKPVTHRSAVLSFRPASAL